MGAPNMVGRFVVAGAAAMLLSNSLRMAAAPAADCAASAQVLEHFGTDLGLDRDVLTRAEGLLGSGAGPEQSASESQLATVAEDATDDLDQAAGEIDSAAQNIAQQLDSLNPAQAQQWRGALSKFEAARNEFEGAAAPPRGSASPGRFIRPLATLYDLGGGVSSTTSTFLNLIGSGALGPGAVTEMGSWVFSGTPDKNPPPSTLHPMTDPYLPVLPAVHTIGGNARRINAQNRILRGLGALQAHNVPAARQELRAARAELDATATPMQHLQSEVNQCAQPQQQPAKSPSTGAAPKGGPKPRPGFRPALALPIILGGAGGTVWVICKAVGCTPGPTPGGWSIDSYAPIVCSAAAGQCSGSITINIPLAVSTGHVWAEAADAGGNAYLGDKYVSSASAPGDVTFALTRRYGGLNSCHPPIMTVGVGNGTIDNGMWATDVNYALSCQ